VPPSFRSDEFEATGSEIERAFSRTRSGVCIRPWLELISPPFANKVITDSGSKNIEQCWSAFNAITSKKSA
jgi:hypothetical protein